MNTEQQNFGNLVLRNVDPAHITINIEANEQRATEQRVARDAANPPRQEPAQRELARLQSELFNLTSRAKNTEVYANNKAAEVRLLETRINDLLKLKKQASDGGNLVGERSYEHGAALLETEKAEAEAAFNRARKVSAGAANDLKAWPHHARLKELQKSLAG